MAEGNARIERVTMADGIEIKITPPRRGWLRLAVGALWFSLGLLFLGLMALASVVVDAPIPGGPPLRMFFSFWAVGAVLVVGGSVRKLAWMFGGSEVVSLRGRRLRVAQLHPFHPVEWIYDASAARALRLGEPPQGDGSRSLGLGAPGVVFEYGARTEGFGLDLSPDLAREVVAHLQPALAAVAPRSTDRPPSTGESEVRATADSLEIEIPGRTPPGQRGAYVGTSLALLAMIAVSLTGLPIFRAPPPFVVLWFSLLTWAAVSLLRRLHWAWRGREILRLTRDGLDYERRGELPSRWHLPFERVGELMVRDTLPSPGERGWRASFSLGEPRVVVREFGFGVELDAAEARALVARIAQARVALTGTRGFRS